MSLKDFKISSVDASQGLSLGETKNETAEKTQSKAYGKCGWGAGCAGGGGQCGWGAGCAGQ